MSVAVVSTSINPHPEAYNDWAREGTLIVAGDRNSPPELEEYVKHLGGQYIHPGDQDIWTFSDSIGWNCVQRRNAAVMQAYADGYDFIITVDDDNFPSANFALGHIQAMCAHPLELTKSNTGWVNIGDFVWPQVNQRGHPLEYFMHNEYEQWTTYMGSCVVSQALVRGNPDCDAVTRLVQDPYVEMVVDEHRYIDAHCIAPFNSQATVWTREWAPFIACLPGEVDRYDDIFASFIAQRVMRDKHMHLHVGVPHVFQNRNPHDFLKDLKREYWGMQRVHEFIYSLNQCMFGEDQELWLCYRDIAHELYNLLPKQTSRFMFEWSDDWKRLAK